MREQLLFEPNRHRHAERPEAGGAVVIERGDSECPHGRAPGLGSLEDRVDEGCDRAALGKHQESAEQEHHDEQGQQPEKDLRSTCGRVRSCTEAGLQK